MRDILHSKVGYNRHCAYYVRDERSSIGDLSMWIRSQNVSGTFWCKLYGNYQVNMAQSNNVIAYDVDNIMLETVDNVEGLTRGSIVVYENDLWIVTNVQKIPFQQETFYGKTHYKTIISLRK